MNKLTNDLSLTTQLLYLNGKNNKSDHDSLRFNPINFIHSKNEWTSEKKTKEKSSLQIVIKNDPLSLKKVYCSLAFQQLGVKESTVFSSKEIVDSLYNVGVPLKKTHIKQLLQTIDHFREELCSKKRLPIFYKITTHTISVERTKTHSYQLQILSKESMQLYFPQKNSSRIEESGSKICKKIFPVSCHGMVLAQTIAQLPCNQIDIFSNVEKRILALEKSRICPQIYGIFHQFSCKKQKRMVLQTLYQLITTHLLIN